MIEMPQFVGTGTRRTTKPHSEAPAKPEPYIATPSLVNAVIWHFSCAVRCC